MSASRVNSLAALVVAGATILVTQTPASARTTTVAAAPSAPLRVVASSTTVLDGSGRAFRPDTGYASGGSLVTSAHAIANTSSPALYQHARLGVTSYALPVSAAGTYFVDMFVAETRSAAPGQRVWNVTAEGASVASSVDVARDAGADKQSHVTFFTPVTDGKLNLRVQAVTGTPLVSAVEVDYVKSATTQQSLFDDSFDGPAGTAPDPSRWASDVGGNGWGNGELQSYTSRTDNAALDGAGHLAITARREAYTGADGIARDYTSARLKTDGRFSFQWGTASARIRIPGGQGLWPAFWMLGSNVATVGWPLCGEIDVMENVGSEPNVSHGTVHGAGPNALQWMSGSAVTAPSPLSDDYHTFAAVWGPTAISMTLDGRTYHAVSASDIAGGWYWNFNTPFFLMLDLAVGGQWPGAPDATTAMPAEMSVDYVRVRG